MKKKIPNGDFIFLFFVVGMVLFGCVMIYSASSYIGLVQYNDSLYFVKKQLIGVVLGGVLMIITCLVPYQRWRKLAIPFLIFSVVALILVFVPGVGITNYGATRWIGFGGISVQPSELAKYAFVLFSASYFTKQYRFVKSIWGVLPILLVGCIICGLIIIEPNMSITICVGILMLSIVFLNGTRLKSLLIVIVPCLLAVPVLIMMEPYRLKRLSAFLDPWASPKGEGYQLIQSLYALGNGGLWGTGLFHSTQKYRFLPFAESDFILSIIGEELGFVGITIFFCCCSVIIYRGIKVAQNSQDRFGYLLACGISLVYGIQVVINALVVSGTIPPTGLPLPLISSGNTSLIITMAFMGVLFNISKQNKMQIVLKMRRRT